MKLSVIVPVYRTESYLRRCIDSILGQSIRDLELILVDDGSPDNCPAICDEYAARDGRVRVIHKMNGGQGLARQIGVKLAHGEFIGFVDSDDWVEPEMYETLWHTASDESCDIVICDWTYHYSDTNTTAPHTQTRTIKPNVVYDSREIREDVLPRVLLEELHGFPWNKLYRARLLKACNLDPAVGLPNMQDWVLNCEYFKNASRMKYLDKPLYHYRIHAGGSLRGERKNYLSTILRLHELRMKYLKEYGLDHREEMRQACIRRFLSMALFAAFGYEFMFASTPLREKLTRISSVVNNSEVIRCLRMQRRHPGRIGMLERVQWFLMRLRMPLFIYWFARSFSAARKAKRAFKKYTD